MPRNNQWLKEETKRKLKDTLTQTKMEIQYTKLIGFAESNPTTGVQSNKCLH